MGMYEYFKKRGISMDKLMCIGADQTSVNAGYLVRPITYRFETAFFRLDYY